MSTTTFVEAVSEDPFVRELHRRAVRVLNDPTLDRQQREFHVRRLQSILQEHQSKLATKAARVAEKNAGREQLSRTSRNRGVADQNQVLARRREFGRAIAQSQVPEPEVAVEQVVATNDNDLTGRNRPVLTLRRA